MILVDTSVWIEFFRGNQEFFKLAELMEAQQVVTIGCIFAELLQGARSQKEVVVLMDYWANLPKLAEEQLWVEAGLLSCQNKYYAQGVGLIDLAILTATRKNQCRLWTLDKKLQNIMQSSEVF